MRCEFFGGLESLMQSEGWQQPITRERDARRAAIETRSPVSFESNRLEDEIKRSADQAHHPGESGPDEKGADWPERRRLLRVLRRRGDLKITLLAK